jgi:hypothetical protein
LLYLTQKISPYDLFSDFEGTIVLPEISYKEWIASRVIDISQFESEWGKRLDQAKKDRLPKSWESYLDLYSGLFTQQDFQDISRKYSLNKLFESWSTRFLKAHNYVTANIAVVTRGFAPIARYFFDRTDVKNALGALRITVQSITGSEPYMDKKGTMKGLKSVVYLKRKFVKDGHIMLGDDGEEHEFANYPYFVNLAKWRTSQD